MPSIFCGVDNDAGWVRCLHLLAWLDSYCELCYTSGVGNSYTEQTEVTMFARFNSLPSYVKGIIFNAQASIEKEDNLEKNVYGLAHKAIDTERAIVYLVDTVASRDGQIADLENQLRSLQAAYDALARDFSEA